MGRIIGIDLGTSNSAAAVMIGGKPTIIPAAEGPSVAGKTVPSVVAFTKDGQILVGEPARRQATINPEGTITGIKRKMGTKEKIKVFDKEYTPEQIAAFILQKIKKDAEAFLGEKVEKAVITVPAYFNDDQRQATKNAGEIAGLEVVRLVNEPTAAAFAYGLDRSDKELKILVFDFGGGTLDVTIMDFGGGVFQVKATAGDTQLGGRDMDEALVNYILEEFKRDTGIDLRNDKMAMVRIREAAEKAKIELSSVLETQINLPFITADATGPKHLVMNITRAKLESLVEPIVKRCAGPLEQAIKDAGLTPQQIDRIILVGGPTKMPIVQKFVADYIGRQPERGIDPMECVAMGAAIQAGIIEGEVKNVVLVDVVPISLGIETLGGIFTKMIERNTPIPTSKTQIFTTAADNQTSVEIHILQGERPLAKDNLSLGRFILDGIPPAPRGVPQIEVTYAVDENGILHVTAKDLATGKEQKVTVTNSNKLSKEEIERMKKEAEMYAEADRKRAEEIQIKNDGDALVYSGRKFLREYGDKINPSDKTALENELNELEKYVKEGNVEMIKAKIESVNQLMSKIGQDMYKQGGGTTGGQNPS
ncbi:MULTISPECIES: molecular chaperone DnaK [Caldisericum]|jgi:molecular chaperone DnaK|uniref:molecular chaperone DnaK n=1 Tax=Caldisericum TaxID=693074 RepID=UPI0039FD78E0